MARVMDGPGFGRGRVGTERPNSLARAWATKYDAHSILTRASASTPGAEAFLPLRLSRPRFPSESLAASTHQTLRAFSMACGSRGALGTPTCSAVDAAVRRDDDGYRDFAPLGRIEPTTAGFCARI